MAIDTAIKRRAAAGVPFGIGVTPDASKVILWRYTVAWSYYVIPTSSRYPDNILSIPNYNAEIEIPSYDSILHIPYSEIVRSL